MKVKRLILGMLIAILPLGLLACGGDGNDDPVQQTMVLEGMAADGYLAGAKVCLDANRNKSCDTGEKWVNTDSSGKFQFLSITGAEAAFPLVLEVSPTTLDLDSNAAVGKTYTLTAPPGSAFVSPLTTLVQERLVQDPALSKTQAEAAIKTQLGVTASLLDDYIARKSQPGADPQYADLHKVAQVAAQLMAGLREEILALDASAHADLIVKVTAEKVAAQLATIAAALSGRTVGQIVADIDAAIPAITVVDLGGTLPAVFTAAMLTSHGKNEYNLFYDNYSATANPPVVQEYALLGAGQSLQSSFMDGHNYVWNSTDSRWDDQSPMFFKHWLINAQGKLEIYSDANPPQLLETCTLVAQETAGLRMTCNGNQDFWYYRMPTP